MDTMELPEIVADEAAQMGTDAPQSLTDVDSDAFLERIREQERFKWLEDKMERWVGRYSVPELLDILGATPEMRGQHEKALVALALSDGTNALSALESLPVDHRPDSFKRLHAVCVEQARRRRNRGSHR
ncbi:MAG: hypothetical protein ACQEVA_18510 [Myxococcota bacterium]